MADKNIIRIAMSPRQWALLLDLFSAVVRGDWQLKMIDKGIAPQDCMDAIANLGLQLNASLKDPLADEDKEFLESFRKQ